MKTVYGNLKIFTKLNFINKNKINFPFKRYEIAKVFRDGPVKLGRDREFTQCDADVVGISGVNYMVNPVTGEIISNPYEDMDKEQFLRNIQEEDNIRK